MKRYKKVLIVGARSKFTKPLVKLMSPLSDQIILHSRRPLAKNDSDSELKIHGEFATHVHLISECDLIIYLAGVHGYGSNQSKPWSFFYYNNVEALLGFIRCLSPQRLSKFIYISSTDVYNYKSTETITEQTKTAPQNLYGLSKVFAEMCVISSCQAAKIPYAIARLGPAYGVDTDKTLGLGKLLRDLISHKPVIVKNGDNQLALLSLNEVAEAMVSLADANLKIANIIGCDASLKVFVKAFCSQVNSNSSTDWQSDGNPIKLNFKRTIIAELLGRMPAIICPSAVAQMQEQVQAESSITK